MLKEAIVVPSLYPHPHHEKLWLCKAKNRGLHETAFVLSCGFPAAVRFESPRLSMPFAVPQLVRHDVAEPLERVVIDAPATQASTDGAAPAPAAGSSTAAAGL